MASKEALLKEIETPMTYISRNDVYYQVPVWVKESLEVLEILKKCNFDIDYEDGEDDKFVVGTRHYVGITQEEADKIKDWLEND